MVVCTTGLSKRYGDFDALADCSVRVYREDIFGLLGPNGAGKTTLIRLLLGYLHASEGSSQVGGVDPTVDGIGVRRQVAYLPGDARLPRHMRGTGVLRFFADMHPSGDLQRSLAVADQLELDLRRRVAFMSTGMRQKLALAVVLGLDTPLLILDEPTANLDPTVRSTVLGLVRQARDEGRTVIFSSHVLSEIEETCDRVAFLRQGKLVHELKMTDLFQRHRITAVRPDVPVRVPDELSDQVRVLDAKAHGQDPLQIDTAGDLAPLLSWLDSLRLNRLRIEPLGLRAVYDSVHDGAEVTV
ncbi:MAG: ABC transporter ATP-binding protein [Pirellulales bacterium]|nr:ABC transporter ATP-binding protein [Pirellulales bacterium]